MTLPYATATVHSQLSFSPCSLQHHLSSIRIITLHHSDLPIASLASSFPLVSFKSRTLMPCGSPDPPLRAVKTHSVCDVSLVEHRSELLISGLPVSLDLGSSFLSLYVSYRLLVLRLPHSFLDFCTIVDTSRFVFAPVVAPWPLLHFRFNVCRSLLYGSIPSKNSLIFFFSFLFCSLES